LKDFPAAAALPPRGCALFEVRGACMAFVWLSLFFAT
jgi:hypothetical protein